MNILNKEQVYKIRELFNHGTSKKDLASQFNVSARTIGRVIDKVGGYKQTPTDNLKPKKTITPKVKVVNGKKVKSKTKEIDINKVGVIGNKFFITMIYNNQTFSCDSSHKHFDQITNAMKEKDFDKMIMLMNPKTGVVRYLSTSGDVEVVDNNVIYKDIICNESITRRIIDQMNTGKSATKLLKFFEKLMLNPNRDAVYQLFDFLEHNDIEIDNDGDVIAWKQVSKDFKDLYTGTIDNSVGKVVKMDRKKVNSDKNVTCASGLHVCAKSYLKCAYCGTGITVKVKLNPRDVVAIPTDYNNAKMRLCRYKVIGIDNEM